MNVELQFGANLLGPTLQEARVGEVVLDQLDAADGVPLRTVCWLADHNPDRFAAALAADPTVADATQVVTTPHGTQFQVTAAAECPAAELYAAAVENDGVFLTGTAEQRRWTLRLRFPGRDALSSFRAACEHTGLDVTVQDVHEQDAAANAGRHGISPAQREILVLATEAGYFQVPRESSLADLADDLGVSSQAASERLRRGLDSLVDSALLTPE